MLLVVSKDTKLEMISTCLVQSHLWAYAKVLHLRQNMQLVNDDNFVGYLLFIGDGNEDTKQNELI